MGYIALIALYAIIIKGINKIDKTMLNYASDNDCSDAVLNYAIKQYQDSFFHDHAVLATGLFFTSLSLLCLFL